MKSVLFALASLALGGAALATPVPPSFDEARFEALGARCEAGEVRACGALVEATGGQCAGPAGSGCAFDSKAFTVVDPEEPMVRVPGLEALGWSRLSTVQHCAHLTEVTDWATLTTDAEFEGMEVCLREHT